MQGQVPGSDVIAVLSAVAAVGSAIAAWSAPAFARQQASAARAQNSLSFVSGVVSRWNSSDSRNRRVEAAKDLLAGRGQDSQALYDVLRQIEEVGILLERKALDPIVVWSQLSTEILHYVAASRGVIDTHRRQLNSQACVGAEIAAKEMEKIERQRGGSDHTLTTAEVRDYLENEILVAGFDVAASI